MNILKKTILILNFVLAISFVLFTCESEAETFYDMKPYEFQRFLIDGIDSDLDSLGLTLQEKEAVEKVQTGNMTLTGYLGYNSTYMDNVKGGYYGISYMECKLLAKALGIDIEIITADFMDVQDAMETYDLDIAFGYWRTEEKDNLYKPTISFMKSGIYIYGNDLNSISDIAILSDKTVGLLENKEFIISSKYIEQYNIDIKTFKDVESIIAAIDKGEISYAVGSLDANYIRKGYEFSEMLNIAFVDVAYTNDIDPNLLSAINKAIEVKVNEQLKTYKQYLLMMYLDLGVFFTEDEIKLIKSTADNPIKIQASNKDFLGLKYINSGGELDGVFPQIIKRISKTSNLNCDLFYNDDSLVKMLYNLGANENTPKVDVGISLYNTDERDYLLFSNPVVETEYVVVGKLDSKNIYNVNDLQDYRVGIIRNWAGIDEIIEDYSYINYVEYNSAEECIKSIRDGEVDYIVVDELIFDFGFYIEKYYELKIAYRMGIKNEIAFGFSNPQSKKTQTLKSIIDKSMQFINIEEIKSEYLDYGVDLQGVYEKLEISNEKLVVVNSELEQKNEALDEMNVKIQQNNNDLKSSNIWLSITIAVLGIALFVIMYLLNRVLDNVKLQKRLGYTDSLTGAKNRRSLYEEVYNCESYFEIAYIDIDRFKELNDVYGHDIGDEVLRMLVYRIKQELTDIEVFRIGGDEFIILSYKKGYLKNADLLGLVTKECQIKDMLLSITASIGIVNNEIDYDVDIKYLLSIADYAMYIAKENGKNKISYADYSLARDFIVSIQLETMFKTEPFEKIFEPAFQPIFNIRTQEIIGFECLARSIDNQYYPDVFIPILDKISKIKKLDVLMYEKCLEFVIKNGYIDKGLLITVNISPKSLTPKLIDELLSINKKHNVDNGCISLEITESVFVTSTSNKIIKRLEKLGFNIIIDDFTAGNSSFVQLMKIDIDVIKIDKLMLDYAIDGNSIKDKGYQILKHLISMMGELNIDCVVEGIETFYQIQELAEMPFDFLGQGYFHSKPMLGFEFLPYIKEVEGKGMLSYHKKIQE